MAVNKQPLVVVVAKFRADTAAVVKFTDSDPTNSSQRRRRHDGVMKARGELLAHRPAEPEAPQITPATGAG